MEWQYTPYTIPLIVVGIGTAIFAFHVYRLHGSKAEARTLVLLMVGVALWSLGYALQWASGDLAFKVFWAKLKYMGIAIVPTAWLVFAIQYTRREKWLSPCIMAVLAIMPLVMLLFVWTNDFHHLYWTDAVIYDNGVFLVLSLPEGVAFWGWAAYFYLLSLFATILIIDAFLRSHRVYRRQAAVVLIAASVPWLANVIYLAHLSPSLYLDITPFAFAITCFACAWGLFRFRLLDVLPLARDAIVENMSDAVIVLDTENHIIDMNPSAERIIGRSVSESVGEPIGQVWSEWSDKLGFPTDKGETSWEIALGDKENRRIYGMRTSHQFDSREQLVCKVIVLRDITERKQAEEMLRASEANYRAIFDTANDAIFVHDIETGDILDANQKMCEVYGYTPEEVRQLNVEALSAGKAPYTQEDALQWLNRATHGDPQIFEWMAKDKSGRVFWVEVNLKRAEIGHSDRLLAIVRDITDRKRAEKALHESEKRYRLLAENVTDVIWTMDLKDMRYTYISPSVTPLRGYSVEEAMAQPLEEALTSASLEIAMNTIAEELATGEKEQDYPNRSRILELEQTCKDGSTVWTEATAVFLCDSTGQPREILGVARDITERKKAEEALHRRESILKATAFAAERFLRAPDWEQNIQAVLARLGEAAGVSRVYIFENHEGEDGELLTSQRYEWVVPGISSQMGQPELHDFPWHGGGMDRWETVLARGEAVSGHVRDFPASEQEILAPQDVKSAMAVPIFVGQTWWGFIGFDECLAEREWAGPEVDALIAAADILGAAVNRKKAEEALRQSEERFRQVAENAQEWIWEVDASGLYRYASPMVEKMLGYKPEEIVGKKHFYDFFNPKEKVALKEAAFRIFEMKQSFRSFPNGNLRKTGEKVILETSGTPILDSNGNLLGYRGADTDITERKRIETALRSAHDELEQRVKERTAELSELNVRLNEDIIERRRAEEQVRILSSKILEAQETERKVVSQEIHDSIGASLAAIKYGLEEKLIEMGGGPVPETKSLEQIVSTVQDTIEETRRISTNLRPPMLDDLGIKATINWLCREFQSVYSNIRIEKQISTRENTIPDSLKIIIFRIMQEALNNIAKHSSADLVRLSLRKTGGRIELRIEDNGQGFDLEGGPYTRGIGIRNMKERAELSGGAFHIQATQGVGTRIMASWPQRAD